MKEYALIVAGGIGSRMKSSVAKQFISLMGRPILMHTIEAFISYSSKIQIVLVLPSNQFDYWKELCSQYNFKSPHQLVTGGTTRFQSVKNGLSEICDGDLIAIHDGVRPLVDENTIAASFRIASNHGSAVAAVRLKESIRMTDQDKTKAVDRSKFRIIQTPQTFKAKLIKDAYALPEDQTLTDDASVAEKAGHEISLFEGTYSNIKITTPEDLVVAEALMKLKAQS